MSKYFVVVDSKKNEQFEAFQKGRSRVIKARMAFADEHFPGWHEIEHYEGLRWHVIYKPTGHFGATEIPDYMKFEKGSLSCTPLKKTAKGKEIAALMDALPPLEGHSAAAKIIGLDQFQFIDGGLMRIAPGVERIKHGEHEGKFLISICSDAKFAADGCKRISDVEAESIRTPKPTKRKKARA